MERLALYHNITVRDGERILVMRNGRHDRVLKPGHHVLVDPLRRLTLQRYAVVRSELPIDRYDVINAERPDLASNLLTLVETGKNEIAIVSYDGRSSIIVGPWQRRAYWTAATRVGVTHIDTTDVLEVTGEQMALLSGSACPYVTETVVEDHETALLYVDGRMINRLPPGRHSHWAVNRRVRVRHIDLRPQPIEISAQEILTKDRISLRLTLTVYRQIVDPEKAVTIADDVNSWLYRLVQLAIREAVSTRSLDEMLASKGTLDAELRNHLDGRLRETGIRITDLGIKDVILPGDIRILVNKVIEAERTAKANLIRRQEETAATRSLLNIAKLMEENPLLLRLKELESLERLVEKVGHIDIHTGDNQGLDALLSNLINLKRINGQ